MTQEIEKLIQEAESRIKKFERNMEIMSNHLLHEYFNGKKSEAEFWAEKLKQLLESSSISKWKDGKELTSDKEIHNKALNYKKQ
jgi:hypothetical protein